MASYLTTATIGQFDVKAYRADGIRYWDALDPDLFDGPVPRTGTRFAYSQVAEPLLQAPRPHDRRARRAAASCRSGSIATPSPTATSCSSRRARRHRRLDDAARRQRSHERLRPDGYPYYLDLHPFLTHYLTDVGGGCAPGGSTGTWSAATGASDGYEQWAVDLAAYAGTQIELSISYVSDDIIQHRGVVVDDVVGARRRRLDVVRERRQHARRLEGPGPPAGSPPNENDWIVHHAGPRDDRRIGRPHRA